MLLPPLSACGQCSLTATVILNYSVNRGKLQMAAGASNFFKKAIDKLAAANYNMRWLAKANLLLRRRVSIN
jgi:hypothetical protein